MASHEVGPLLAMSSNPAAADQQAGRAVLTQCVRESEAQCLALCPFPTSLGSSESPADRASTIGILGRTCLWGTRHIWPCACDSRRNSAQVGMLAS